MFIENEAEGFATLQRDGTVMRISLLRNVTAKGRAGFVTLVSCLVESTRTFFWIGPYEWILLVSVIEDLHCRPVFSIIVLSVSCKCGRTG